MLKKILISAIVILISCGANTKTQVDNDLLAKVKYEGLYGFIDTSGEWVVKPEYNLAHSFSENFAVVSIHGILRDGVFYIPEYGFIDKNGKIIINDRGYTEVLGFREGHAVVEINMSNYGFIDTRGNLIKSGFTELYPFSEGAAIALDFEEGIIGHVNVKGEWITQFEYQKRVLQVGSFYEGLALIVIKNIDGEIKFGYIDKDGQEVIPAVFESAMDFSEGLAGVMSEGKYNFINTLGEIVIETEYDNVGFFSEGLCRIDTNEGIGYIDSNGIIKIEPIFDNGGKFSEGLASVLIEGKYGFIDKDGILVISPFYDEVSEFHYGYCCALSVSGEVGFINTTGDWIIEPRYEVAQNFVNITETTPLSWF